MFDLYQYLPRFAAARLARNGSQTSFILDVFARAAEQIRRIPPGGRAASPTDRLTLRATNSLPPFVPRPMSSLPSLARSPYPLPSYSQVVLPSSEPRVLAPARSIGRHNKKSKRQEILYARSTDELSSALVRMRRGSAFPRSLPRVLPKYLGELRRATFDSINVYHKTSVLFCRRYFTVR